MPCYFIEKLDAAVQRNDSLVCVGLDPDPTLMPIADIATFNKKIIEATNDLVCCYKPNIAFYEAAGSAGMYALRETLDAIPPYIPVIVDAKRGDIGNTSAAYAKAIFDVLGADAMTVNAWGGLEAVEPYLEYADKGVIIWCRSSNPSAADFQDLVTDFEGGRYPMWQVTAMMAQKWNTRGNVGIVMGATYPEQLAEARKMCPDMPILVPGVGTQAGDLKAAVEAGIRADKAGIIVNASRSIIYASRDKDDYELSARAAALRLRDQINAVRYGE